MKIGVLSGAYKNAGDFLIVNRSISLLKYVLGEIEIKIFLRNQSLENQLDEINKCDVIVFAGGPGYIPSLYPKVMPLVNNLSSIKAKIFILGMGWFGPNTSNEALYNYKFTDQSLSLFERVLNDGFLLGCREYESAMVLKNNGIYGTVMTGCPAWYNLDVVTIPYEYQFGKPFEINTIYISDPAKLENNSHVIELVNYLKIRFPHATFKYIFHRGIVADKYTSVEAANVSQKIIKWLEAEGIECVDISYSEEGFSIYKDCDLHVGFRVHAHIYNLSNRNLSILFEEDGRGAGVNNALGLKNITTYDSRKLDGSLNKFLVNNLDDYLFQLESNNFYKIQSAYKIIEDHFSLMVQHISMIKEVVNSKSVGELSYE